MPFRGWLTLFGALVGLAGCGTWGSGPEVHRATEGPTAQEVYMHRFVAGYGRAPTFDETSAFRDDLDQRVSQYLERHPDVSTSPRVSQFAFSRRVAVGMSKEEVVLLVGPPVGMTQEGPRMQEAAKQFWPAIREQAKEMWVYPGQWSLYFNGDQLVDLTVVGTPPI